MHFYLPIAVITFILGGLVGTAIERIRWNIRIYRAGKREGDESSPSQNYQSDKD